MSITEQDLDKLAEQVSEPARANFRKAYLRVLATGKPTAIQDGDEFVQFTMEGEHCVVRRLPKGERPGFGVASAPVSKVSTRTITLEIPDSLAVSDFDARMLFAAKLYERGYLSAGRCAALVGMDKWDFIFKLDEYGTPYLLPTWEDWQQEKDTLNANHNRRHKLPDSTDQYSAA